jgi:hypothetical protein
MRYDNLVMAAIQKIEIELTDDEAERLRCEAERRGLPIAAAARDLLVAGLPASSVEAQVEWKDALAELARLRARQPMETDVVELLAAVRRELDERL